MKTPRSIFGILMAYAQLTRASNLPTIFSNVLMGSAVAAGQAPLPWRRVLIAVAALSALYAAAMATNDAIDAQADRLTRPGRPIPSGRIGRRHAWVLSAVAAAMALWMLAWTTLLAAGMGIALTASALGYNVAHKKCPKSVVLMGVCRGLVYVTAAAAVATEPTPIPWTTLLGLATVLALYTTILAWIARTEKRPQIGGRRWWSVAMPAVALGAAAWVRPGCLVWAVGVGLVMVVWLARGVRFVFRDPPQTSQAVMVGLSGMCLVDAYGLTLLDRPLLAVTALACFAVTVWAHRQVAGT